MLGRHSLNFHHIIQVKFLPPINFCCARNIMLIKKGFYSQRSDNFWMVSAKNHPHTLNIEVVIMIVSENNHMYLRNVSESDARKSRTFRTCPCEWAHPATPDRIGQKVQPIYLNQKC